MLCFVMLCIWNIIQWFSFSSNYTSQILMFFNVSTSPFTAEGCFQLKNRYWEYSTLSQWSDKPVDQLWLYYKMITCNWLPLWAFPRLRRSTNVKAGCWRLVRSGRGGWWEWEIEKRKACKILYRKSANPVESGKSSRYRKWPSFVMTKRLSHHWKISV